MRILFDHGAPAPLIPFLVGHAVTKTKEAGWDRLANGELLTAAEQAGFEVLLTTDKNMVDQQNFRGRTIAIAVLGNSQWRIVQRYVRPNSRCRQCCETGDVCGGRYSVQVAANAAPGARAVTVTTDVGTSESIEFIVG
jgi:hypothetical protein